MFCRLAVVAGNEPKPSIPLHRRSLFPDGRSAPEQPAEIIESVRSLFFAGAPVPERQDGPATFTRQLKYCCGMPNCPIEAFNKVAAGVINVPKTSERDGEQAYRKLRSRFTIGQYEPEDHQEADDRPFAHFRLTCRHEDQPGSFAIALNTLLFTRLQPMPNSPAGFFNLTYISSYECHDERHGVFTCYGRRTTRDAGSRDRNTTRLTPRRVIEHVELYPIRGARNPEDPWGRYADLLAAFLNEDLPAAHQPFEVFKGPGRNWADRLRITRKPADKATPARSPRWVL